MDAQTRNAQTPVPVGDGPPESRPLSTGASSATTDGRLIELWMHGKSSATKEAYRSDLSKYLDFTEGKPLRSSTLADVQEFADFLSGILATATQARILAAIKSLFAFGHQVGYLPFDVGRPVKLPARPTTSTR